MKRLINLILEFIFVYYDLKSYSINFVAQYPRVFGVFRKIKPFPLHEDPAKEFYLWLCKYDMRLDRLDLQSRLELVEIYFSFKGAEQEFFLGAMPNSIFLALHQGLNEWAKDPNNVKRLGTLRNNKF